jgi:uncharacterized protein
LTLRLCVDKLPRLMQHGPPQFIDPLRLAESKEDLSGSLSLEGMGRLQQLLSENTAVVEFTLRFERDENESIRILGNFNASLSMQCQRCLQQVAIDIEKIVSVGLVKSESEAAMLPKELEPLLLKTKLLCLPMFLEDEILLALPLAPNHDNRECHRQVSNTDESVSRRPNPFAVLKDLKIKNSND